MYLNIKKDNMINPQLTSYLMGENRAFPIREGTRQECPLSPFLFNIVLEMAATAIKQEKEKTFKFLRKKQNYYYSQMTWYLNTPIKTTRTDKWIQ